MVYFGRKLLLGYTASLSQNDLGSLHQPAPMISNPGSHHKDDLAQVAHGTEVHGVIRLTPVGDNHL